jgi:hypothetical protein
MKNKNLYFLIFILLFTVSCNANKDNANKDNAKLQNDIPKILKSDNKTQKPAEKQVKIAGDLIKASSNNLMLKKILDYHDFYYSGLHQDLDDLLAITSANLKNRDLENARNLAIKNMNNDADLMDEVKEYVINIDNSDENGSLIRFSYNRTPFILRKAAEFLADNNYFNSIVSGIYPNKFHWNALTFLGGIDNFDEKGTVAISALTASLVYLLDNHEMLKNLYNHHSVIYSESITAALEKNPQLLAKIQKNYHLFSADDNLVSKVYEAYEFGGDKDLKVMNNHKYVPLDCSSGIGRLLDMPKQKPFSTYHLASYYDEFFGENSAYWKFNDWQVRSEIMQKLIPLKFNELSSLEPGTIIVFRDLENEKSLEDPQGYVGNGGHVAVVLGVDGDDLYYLSWERNLEYENKSGLGVDLISILEKEQEIAHSKLAIFTYKANFTKAP